ncbi:Duffy receptor beta form [Bienertia sinuspersici]
MKASVLYAHKETSLNNHTRIASQRHVTYLKLYILTYEGHIRQAQGRIKEAFQTIQKLTIGADRPKQIGRAEKRNGSILTVAKATRSEKFRPDQIRSEKFRPDQIRSEKFRSDQKILRTKNNYNKFRSDQIRKIQIRSDQIRKIQIRSDQIRKVQIRKFQIRKIQTN